MQGLIKIENAECPEPQTVKQTLWQMELPGR